VSEPWVVNSSPLIVLARISQIDLLIKLGNALIIPEGVAQEIDCGPATDPARNWLRETGVSFVRKAPMVHSTIGGWDLGLGESEVLAMAWKMPGAMAILDDKAARQCASSLQIPILGTLGILWRAKKAGFISALRPFFASLVKEGFRIDEKILTSLMQQAGE